MYEKHTQGPNVNYNPENGKPDKDPTISEKETTIRLKDKNKEKSKLDMDSVQNSYNVKVIDAAKTFLVDYGDMITQLSPTERIIVSNQGDRPRIWVNQYFNTPNRSHLVH